MRRKIIPYNPKLKEYARELRNNSTFTEILMWNYLKKNQLLGYDFDRQRPIENSHCGGANECNTDLWSCCSNCNSGYDYDCWFNPAKRDNS